MTDDGRLALQLADHRFEVVGDLFDRLAGEDFGVRACLPDRLGIVWPARCQGGLARFLKEGLPAVPAAGQ
jgi:hypothetical protein